MDSPFDYEDDSSTGCGKSTYDEATKEYTAENPNCIQGWTKSACGEWSPVAEIKTKVRLGLGLGLGLGLKVGLGLEG